MAAAAVVALAATFGAPTAGFAHENGAAAHIAEDAVAHDPTEERALERRTEAITASDAAVAAAAVTGTEGAVGSWGPKTDWPVVGVHVALLPNGKVLAYDSVGDRATETFAVHDHTRATVWDPATGTHTPVDVPGFNIFCSGMAHLMDGSLFAAGGNKNAALNGIRQTHIFNEAANTWTRGPDMVYERWYPTVTPLANGEMLIIEGGPDTPEVRTAPGGLRTLSSATQNLPLYPWMDVAPDGRAFYSGPDQTMRSLQPNGTGTWQNHGQRDPINRDYGSHTLFDIGKILVAGGASSSKDTRVIDLNGANPQVTPTAPMAFGRRQHNLTVLADGSVLSTGGNSSGAGLVDLNNGVYPGELWDPATGTWTTLAAMEVTRQYHSTALLLADGRVLSSGGGICGTCDQVGYLAKNAEVYTPPYLFKKDGSGELAARPSVTAAPSRVNYGEAAVVTTPDAATIEKVALIRLGSVTHSVNMEQRYVPLTFSARAGALDIVGPATSAIAPPGPYMLVAVDDAGVPSVARMLIVEPDNARPTVSLTQPADGATSTAPATIAIAATAADADGSIAKVEFFQGTTKLGEDTTSPYAYTWTGVAAGAYSLSARATDDRGATTTSAARSVTVTAAPPPPVGGPVAAFGFEEGSGSVTRNAESANDGTLSGATWATNGRFGNAVNFNGSNSTVTVADHNAIDLTTRMTLEAWVRPATLSSWRSVILKEQPGNLVYALYANSNGDAPAAYVYTNADRGADGTTKLPVNAWTHLATTYDGTTLRLFVNGAQVGSRAISGALTTSSGALRFGGNAVWGENFNGTLDEIRVYDRALTATEIQADMTRPVSSGPPPPPPPPDTTPPTAPGGLTAAGEIGAARLAWTAATDNVGVTGYRVHRSTTAGFTPSDANRIATPTTTTYVDRPAGPGTYRYRVVAVDAAGNAGPASAEASANVLADAPPTVSITAPAASATVSGSAVAVTATAADDVGVLGVRFRIDGTAIGVEDTSPPYATTWNTAGYANGSHVVSAVARDAAGNTTTSAPVTVTVDNTPPPAGAPIAAYGFEEGSGTITRNAAGLSHDGTLTGAAWTTAGRFGNALGFNGASSYVTVPDDNTLDLRTAMTLEAWVKPTTLASWRSIILKEQPGNLVYALYANSGDDAPAAHVYTSGDRGTEGTAKVATNTWTHLATTYDGTTLRLFVNGVQVSSRTVGGAITTSSGALRFGGNTIWPETFNGLIDEIRIYGRVLTASEIQTDMTRPVVP